MFAILAFVLILVGLFTVCSAYIRANQKVIVISPGHSIGYDSGATSNYKDEAQVNQELAGRVTRNLINRGYKVYITHTTDEELAPYRLLDQASGSSLRALGNAINSVSPDLTLVLHHNSGGTTSSGYELYWSSYRSFDSDGVYTVGGLWSTGSAAYRDSSPCPAAQASQTFAQIVKNHMEGIPNLSFRKIVERDDYLPAHVTSPCILYEGGYLSNPTEAQYLASDAYQADAANRLTEAIVEYIGDGGVEDNELPTVNSVYSSTTETTDMNYTVSANVSDNIGISAVRFATWTENNGQDDLYWTEGVNNGNGNWSAQINVSDHNNETGVYTTHVYAYDYAGNFTGVVGPAVTIGSKAPTTPGLSIQQVNSNVANAYAVKLGADQYKFAVWSEQDGQDDLIWYDGQVQTDGSSKCIINRSDHHNDPGKYFVHCYANGTNFVGGNEIDFGRITYDYFLADLNGQQIDMNVTGLKAPYGASNIRFAVWSENNGQDDLVWYPSVQKDGYYAETIPANKHYDGGRVWVHAYLTDQYGLDQFVGGAALNVKDPSTAPTVQPSQPQQSAGGYSISVGQRSGNRIPVQITGIPSNTQVLVPVWSDANGQDDLIWYPANEEGTVYNVSVNLAQHSGTGTYNLHVYAMDGAANLNLLTGCTFDVPQPAIAEGVTANTPVMGISGNTAAQFVNLFNELGGQFPDYYIQRGVTLGQFCQMYIDEANAEGVRADLAFCQMIHETGVLRFGGDVKISQFNFAGLGAVGGGAPGEDFAAKYGDNANGIQMGIRAQVQHLKAYGSTDPLNNACVDSRFDLVSRGRAQTIAGLTGTWAADPNYATALVSYMQRIK